ncbi:MAG TPA: hypothetical protein VII95_04425 [Terriglobales bacterium]
MTSAGDKSGDFLYWIRRRFAGKTSPDDLRFSSHGDAARRYRGRMLLVLVVLQCVLYGINLKLLPMWGDETFTVKTVVETPARIIQIVREDIHPPLYFLLAHWWNRIPLGSDPLVRLRALSAFFAILTTVFLDRYWLRDAPASLRNWFLLFWTFSPCLLLYSRMARSYSMQVFFAAMAIWYLLRLAEDAAGWRDLAAFVVALAALLYTHYLPGIAVWAGANLLLAIQLRHGRSIWKTWLLPNALVAVLYLPWLMTLSGALGQWRHSAVYSLTGNLWAEQVLKLCYWFYSFTFGEAIPIWLLPVTVVLALPCLWLLVSGARLRRQWLWPALFAAVVAFLGATRWVSYSFSFMGARLLFLLPLFLVALAAGVTTKHRVGTALGVILLAANLAGLWTYYEARDLLNAGYLVPNQRIAAEIALHSRSEDTVVWIDEMNFDGTTLEYYLPKSFRLRWLTSPESVEAARAELKAGAIRHVWFVRSSHDISPGHVFEELEAQMRGTWSEHTLYSYVPFSPTHLAILRALALLRHQDGNQPRRYMCEVREFQGPR